jgi:RHS repeat-associated protein
MYFQETPPYGQYTYDVLVGKFITLSNQFKDVFVLSEWHMYGSSRLGIQKPKNDGTLSGVETGRELVHIEFNGSWSSYEVNYADTSNTTITTYQMSYEYYSLTRGEKNYELVNHLGNVLVVISDKKLKTCTGDTVNYYTADVLQATDYSAFGVLLKDREFYADTLLKYRFGYQGSERDNEACGSENAYTTHFRELDPRLGRWWAIDPEAASLAHQSPYVSMDDNPISNNDPMGDIVDLGEKGNGRGRNKVNIFFARILNRTFNAKYKEMKDDPLKTYHFKMKANTPSLLVEAGGQVEQFKDNPNQFNVFYSSKGNGDNGTLDSDAPTIGINFDWFSIPFKRTRTIDPLNKRVGNNDTRAGKKTRDKYKVAPGASISLDFYGWADEIIIYSGGKQIYQWSDKNTHTISLDDLPVQNNKIKVVIIAGKDTPTKWKYTIVSPGQTTVTSGRIFFPSFKRESTTTTP